MNWKKIPNEFKNNRDLLKNLLPKNEPFLVLWKGVICLCEYDEDIDRFYLGMMPASYLGFWKLDVEREGKFTHFCEIKIPSDY